MLVSLFTCKLRLVRYGLLKEAEDVGLLHLRSSFAKFAADGARGMGDREDAAESSNSEGEEDEVILAREKFVKVALQKAGREGRRLDWTQEKHEAVGQARRAILKEFLNTMGLGRACRNCRAICPSYRKAGSEQIFRKRLGDKDKAANAQAGRRINNPLVILAKRRMAAEKSTKKGKELPNGHIDEGVADLSSPSSEEEEEGDDVNDSSSEEEHDTEEVVTATQTAKPQQDEYVNPGEVYASLVLLFEKEAPILNLVYGGKSKQTQGAELFFIKNLLIPPNKFRPEAKTSGNRTAQAAQNAPYIQILERSQRIRQLQSERSNYDDLQQPWINLQQAVNGLIDKEKSGSRTAEDGIKQKLEKKEGLFRHNMMGKRVNFAARTVISPDPNIETNEIGVPPVFAKKLTYPEPVFDHNYYDLKAAVLNGPDVWPGATAIENENGQVINLRSKTYDERLALANQLMAPSNTQSNGARGKKVHRHLNNGDVVIMNRQPTLHKPSMMVHRARVLPAERTLRMHYANCNTYNADFDGDEMNMHFPQTELGRAEASTIADTDHQYLSATAGKPLRGLIQDHISISVQLTKRDTFFTREQYHQLLYASLRPENSHTATGKLVTQTPAILKPRKLWTGKQVISSVLENIIPSSHGGLTLNSKSSTSSALWGDTSEEQEIVFDKGYLAQGLLDKAQIGPTKGGFVHAVYEAYGHIIAGKLLSVMSRLLTKMLHTHAFSCGVEDLVLTPKGDRDRLECLKDVDKIGLDVASKYVSMDDMSPKPTSTDPELMKRLEGVLRDDSKQAVLDELAKAAANNLSGEITKACLPVGLIKPFPKNFMQAMTNSGAKGSKVNANLISCNLGSQVLEGRRVPTMVSGKTLPSFKPFETSLRAGGYITQRFLTGIKPQEYFFHAMAGREGLIDTAVKTSRSGYLQRCLVKGMEGLRVEYDTSVRDSDGTMVQFLYGEDGLDVCKSTYLDNFSFASKNFFSLFEAMGVRDEYASVIDPTGQIEERMKETIKAVKKANVTGNDREVPDPVLTRWQPGRWAGAMSEKMYSDLRKYCQDNPDRTINDKKTGISGKLRRKDFEGLMNMRYLKSVVEPGEAVGVVAGQSIGEPSTQMTLNTFHLAGHAAKNVTLGIPRLREIVMTASPKISTPAMTLRVIEEVSKEDAVKFAKGISKLSLAEIVDSVRVKESIGKGSAHGRAKMYDIKLQFFPKEEYGKEYAITMQDVLNAIVGQFVPSLQAETRAKLGGKKRKKGSANEKSDGASDAVPEVGKSTGREQRQKTPDADGLGGGAEDDDSDDDDGDATNAKSRKNRKEGAGYDAKDEEDEADLERVGVRDTDSDDEDQPMHKTSDSEDEDLSTEARTQRDRARVIERAAVIEENVKRKNEDVVSFDFDYVSGSTCHLSLEYDANTAKILMLNIVESCCHETVIQAVPQISACTASTEKVSDPSNPDSKKEVSVIFTQGVNIPAMQEFQEVLDPHYIYTNSIHDMLRYYGVEAARATIVREMSDVFEGHSISVNNRHLNLIADVMTRGGGFVGFNRLGMRSSTSPFMKMSFETTVGFLKDAILEGEADELKNPSSRIVVGRLGKMGTGMVDVLVPVKKMIGADEKEDAGSSDEDDSQDGSRDSDRMSL